MKYKDVSKLRYGSIIILTDQDPDGSHIKGLIINMLEYFWPDLLQIEGFIKAYNTPIVKVWKKTDKKKKNIKMFYTMSEFENWTKDKCDGDLNAAGWEHKYYKGLGTSTDKEAKESFYNFDDNLVTFFWEEENDDSLDNTPSDSKKSEISRLKADLKKKMDIKKTKKSSSDDGEDGDDNNGEGDADSNLEEGEKIPDDVEEDDATAYSYMKSRSHAAITKAFDETKVVLRKE